MSRRLTALAFGSVCAGAIALTGCSSSGDSAPSGTPAKTSPAAVASVAATGSALPSPAPSSPSPVPSPGGALAVSITGLPTQPVLSLGGAPLEFTVSLHNSTTGTYDNITPVVSLAHCTCNSSPVEMAPGGTMQERDPVTGDWRSVFYDAEGTGTDFLNVTEQPGFTLRPGGTASFVFRIALYPRKQQPSIHDGQTAIDVTVEALPAHAVIGAQKAATATVAVISGTG
ncbi:MAG TPA: hypothetical protein VE733_28960 [Streptosporangiaceae bacterium]|jgi:hypothetical protein|nr:hypothetical protein [Streptosporangiaceae bacterium]